MKELLQVRCYLIRNRWFVLHIAFVVQIPARLRTYQVYSEECRLNVSEAENTRLDRGDKMHCYNYVLTANCSPRFYRLRC